MMISEFIHYRNGSSSHSLGVTCLACSDSWAVSGGLDGKVVAHSTSSSSSISITHTNSSSLSANPPHSLLMFLFFSMIFILVM